jgi:hypothetical protein
MLFLSQFEFIETNFKAFSQSTTFSQKMNLLKIIAYFLPIFAKIFLSHFENLKFPSKV